MSSTDRDLLYVIHIEERIQRIEGAVAQGRGSFETSHIIQDAIIRNFEVIGEAAKRLSPSLTTQYDGVPWKQIAGFRDVLIHNYMGVDLDEVWNVIEHELPRLRRAITAMRRSLEESDSR